MSSENLENRHGYGISRRHFLGIGATGLATAALTGIPRHAYAGVNRMGQPYAVIRTSEHYGDEEMILTFPVGWEVNVHRMNGHDAPTLNDDQIREALRNTINTRPLADLADGKRKITITFDDLTRPTPTYRVAPILLEELHAAGVKPEQITFQGSFGSHSAMYQQDMAIKLGPQIVANYACWNHDCFAGFTDFGTTPEGIPVKLSNRFGEADLKICISGVKKHGLAGYGGGAKAIIPGVAAFEAISHLHDVVNRKYRTTECYVNNPVRLDIEHAARMANVDMSINIVMNGDRNVAGVFAGDIVDAHRAAVRVAHENYHTDLPKEPADVVIYNHYPQSVEAYFGFGPQALKDGGTIVLVQDTPAGQRKIHYLGWSGNGGNSRRPEHGLPVSKAGQVIVFNRFAAKWDELKYSPDVHFASTWADVESRLQHHHGANAKVAVFPTAPLQHEPKELRI
jgi:nickel-dependent lactate racemase